MNVVRRSHALPGHQAMDSLSGLILAQASTTSWRLEMSSSRVSSWVAQPGIAGHFGPKAAFISFMNDCPDLHLKTPRYAIGILLGKQSAAQRKLSMPLQVRVHCEPAGYLVRGLKVVVARSAVISSCAETAALETDAGSRKGRGRRARVFHTALYLRELSASPASLGSQTQIHCGAYWSFRRKEYSSMSVRFVIGNLRFVQV